MRTGLLVQLMQTNRGRVRGLAIVAAGLFFSTFALAATLGLRFNASPSLPLGLYIISDDREASLVEFCPQEPYASFAAVRGYRDRGSCPDGASPFMKHIVAEPGDTVEVSPRGIAVNGREISNTEPRDRDSAGRPLAPWPFGKYQVSSDTVWVASSYHPRSFDSRYFGPIPAATIRNRIRPLLTAW